jgi:hypothetical protein
MKLSEEMEKEREYACRRKLNVTDTRTISIMITRLMEERDRGTDRETETERKRENETERGIVASKPNARGKQTRRKNRVNI